MDRSIALDQEESIVHHGSGWSNFSDFLNARMSGKAITFQQSQCLFVKHFSQQILISHGKENTFQCPSNATMDVLVASIWSVIGKDGGTVPGAMKHSCMDCTHKMRYCEDLIAKGVKLASQADAIMGENLQHAGVEDNDLENENMASCFMFDDSNSSTDVAI